MILILSYSKFTTEVERIQLECMQNCYILACLNMINIRYYGNKNAKIPHSADWINHAKYCFN